MSQNKSPRSLSEIRVTIDALDARILSLLNERAVAVLEAGASKLQEGRPVYDPSREQRILDRLHALNEGPLDTVTLEALYRGLISQFRAFEQQASHVSTETKSENAVSEELGSGAEPAYAPTIAVVGCGLMGGSFAKAAHRARFGRTIHVLDTQPLADEIFASHGLQRAEWEDVWSADVIVLALPVDGILEFLRTQVRNCRPGTVIFDFGSTKQAICEEAERHCPPGVAFVGGHPLCGKAESGFAHSDASLFRGKAFFLTPTKTSTPDAIARVSEWMQALGAVVMTVPAAKHDQELAHTSHLCQVTATALCLAVEDMYRLRVDSTPPVPPPSLLEMTRLGRSSGRVWSDILATNAPAVLQAIDRLMSSLRELRDKIPSGDIQAHFTRANAVRAAILHSQLPAKEESSDDHNHETRPHGRSVA
ncbi:MAG: prephenate dehydrogenase/arogenate dehydrogenase family protein [Bdellovibrionaceae bacterium]|nr:prephenate dehydrogenase/arogenate dehydrogenase family protein [Pseudobdellovibrionaceae bacterium]